MTIRNPVVSQEVEQHLTARLPGWQHRVRFGRGGGMSVPIPCEVCGKIVFHNLANLEAKVRRGDRLLRYCSRSCMRRSVAMRREGRT